MAIKVALNHWTHYRYERPTILGPHVVRLKPAPHCRTPILAYRLDVRPHGHFINWQQDPFGNYLARLVFPEPVRELRVEVDLVAELTVINPFDFFVEDDVSEYPFAYDAPTQAELAPYLRIDDTGPRLERWLGENRPPDGPIIDWLVALNRRLWQDVSYRVRMEPGVQTVDQTLELASGSCRDSGWLLVQLLRHAGLAARFVSGYLVQLAPDEKPLEGPAGPSADFTDLHAWAEVYLPGAGWVGLDPTSGLLAGEGHIPLACTPLPSSAAPISGVTGGAASEFAFANTVRRFDETVRITKPYTESDWQSVLALGEAVDARLAAAGVDLTMGGEPTFVSVDDMEGAEWNHAALGEKKLELAGTLMTKMRDAFAPNGLPTFGQGKWYPGEPTPRWALSCHWRVDGLPLWRNPRWLDTPGAGDTVASDEATSGGDEAQARGASGRRFVETLADRLGVDATCIRPVYEDPLYHVHLESLLPADETLDSLALADERSRRNLADRLARGLDRPVGHMLPLRHTDGRWQTSHWPLRRDEVFLVPGDSPAGLRLPLDSLRTAAGDEPLLYAEDAFDPHEPLPIAPEPDRPWQRPELEAPLARTIATALCVEWRDGALHVFLPPLRSAVSFVHLVHALERTAGDCETAIVIEGYEPPQDARLKQFRLTPDPGVLEVNIHPVASFAELVGQTETLHALARESRLSAEKFLVDGRHTGTGGGNHITFGGTTPASSPFLRRPRLLGSLIAFWQHHPSLSYLFSGLFVGPTSQAPRIDEARNESLYELEMALARLPEDGSDQPWLVDRLLRNLLIDVTGNTHRVEICIDKLYSPDGPSGRLGLVEFRAFEMPPHPRMAIVQGLLLRALIARFAEKPYGGPLVRWGTDLHNRFMLPHFLWADMLDVVRDLAAHGIAYDPNWLDAFWEFRFPVYGVRRIGDITLELRAAIEPWHVLGEQASAGGMSRYVDSSMERLQLKVSGLRDERHVITCNGHALPLQATGVEGEYVVGVRYRAWQPPNCLHPDLPVDVPLVFDVVDTWLERSLGGCAYHTAHPGGRSYDDVPVNANVAEARRLARFEPDYHTPASTSVRLVSAAAGAPTVASFDVTPPRPTPATWRRLAVNPHYPHTVDLRHAR